MCCINEIILIIIKMEKRLHRHDINSLGPRDGNKYNIYNICY